MPLIFLRSSSASRSRLTGFDPLVIRPTFTSRFSPFGFLKIRSGDRLGLLPPGTVMFFSRRDPPDSCFHSGCLVLINSSTSRTFFCVSGFPFLPKGYELPDYFLVHSGVPYHNFAALLNFKGPFPCIASCICLELSPSFSWHDRL